MKQWVKNTTEAQLYSMRLLYCCRKVWQTLTVCQKTAAVLLGKYSAVLFYCAQNSMCLFLCTLTTLTHSDVCMHKNTHWLQQIKRGQSERHKELEATKMSQKHKHCCCCCFWHKKGKQQCHQQQN